VAARAYTSTLLRVFVAAEINEARGARVRGSGHQLEADNTGQDQPDAQQARHGRRLGK
jgi:hypothetical protein